MKEKTLTIKAEITSLGYCAEGIGRVQEGDYTGKTVFIENTAPGDIVEATVISIKKNYLKAQLTSILQEGQTRVKPLCALAKVCGGCQWQHIDYNEQLKAKTLSIKDSLSKIALVNPEVVKEALKAETCWNYRAKVQVPLGRTKNSKRLLAGYYRPRSHEIVNMKYCPVQPEAFDAIIETARDLYNKHKFEIYNEKTSKGYLRHIVLRQGFATKDILLTFVINSKKIWPHFIEYCEQIAKKHPQIRGITVNINNEKTNVIFGKTSKIIYGYDHILETIGNKTYHISDKSFFQVNPPATRLMFDKIREIIETNGAGKQLLDLYAGVAAMSIYVSDLFEEVVAVESEKSCLKNTQENFLINKVDNIKYINKTAETASIEDLSGKHFDWIILDPPRAGCDKTVLETCVQTGCNNIIYASCNPTTLARDLKILIDAGYVLQEVHPLDMFCHSYHIESISYLRKNA